RQRLLGRGLGGRQPEVRLFRSSLSRHGAIRLIEVHGVLGRGFIGFGKVAESDIFHNLGELRLAEANVGRDLLLGPAASKIRRSRAPAHVPGGPRASTVSLWRATS